MSQSPLNHCWVYPTKPTDHTQYTCTPIYVINSDRATRVTHMEETKINCNILLE